MNTAERPHTSTLPPSSSEQRGRVLVIDDDPFVRRSVARVLRAAGHEVAESENNCCARTFLASNAVDVALVDVLLPDGCGLDLLPYILARTPQIGVVVMTGSDQRANMLAALRLGVSAYLRKPLDPLAVEAQVAVALAGARQARRRRAEGDRIAHDVALWHHERWDGSGYPHALLGASCPWEARAVAIVDVYDALSESRCYKPAWEEERVIQHFREGSGKLYEASLVQALLDNLSELRAVGQAFPDSAGWELAQSGTWLSVAPDQAHAKPLRPNAALGSDGAG